MYLKAAGVALVWGRGRDGAGVDQPHRLGAGVAGVRHRLDQAPARHQLVGQRQEDPVHVVTHAVILGASLKQGHIPETVEFSFFSGQVSVRKVRVRSEVFPIVLIFTDLSSAHRWAVLVVTTSSVPASASSSLLPTSTRGSSRPTPCSSTSSTQLSRAISDSMLLTS